MIGISKDFRNTLKSAVNKNGSRSSVSFFKENECINRSQSWSLLGHQFARFRFWLRISVCRIFKTLSRVEDKMPNIFKCLEADVLGGRLGSKKWIQANFTWPKFSEIGKS